MVDSADLEKVEASRNELHSLLEKPQLQGIPVNKNFICVWLLHPNILIKLFQVLVLGNKKDLSPSLDEKELIERM